MCWLGVGTATTGLILWNVEAGPGVGSSGIPARVEVRVICGLGLSTALAEATIHALRSLTLRVPISATSGTVAAFRHRYGWGRVAICCAG